MKPINNIRMEPARLNQDPISKLLTKTKSSREKKTTAWGKPHHQPKTITIYRYCTVSSPCVVVIYCSSRVTVEVLYTVSCSFAGVASTVQYSPLIGTVALCWSCGLYYWYSNECRARTICSLSKLSIVLTVLQNLLPSLLVVEVMVLAIVLRSIRTPQNAPIIAITRWLDGWRLPLSTVFFQGTFKKVPFYSLEDLLIDNEVVGLWCAMLCLMLQ